MSDSPVIHADLGDGQQRRFFLGYDEIRLIEQECGAGFYTLFQAIASGSVRHQQVERVIRLALIGGGADPAEAAVLAQYYVSPPRPLKTPYLIAGRVLDAVWLGGTKEAKAAGEKIKLTDTEADGLVRVVEANLIRAGYSAELSGLSVAQVIALHDEVFKPRDGKVRAPDADTTNAIKSSLMKAGK